MRKSMPPVLWARISRVVASLRVATPSASLGEYRSREWPERSNSGLGSIGPGRPRPTVLWGFPSRKMRARSRELRGIPVNSSCAVIVCPIATLLRRGSSSTTTRHGLGVSMRPASLSSPMAWETASRVHATMQERSLWLRRILNPLPRLHSSPKRSASSSKRLASRLSTFPARAAAAPQLRAPRRTRLRLGAVLGHSSNPPRGGAVGDLEHLRHPASRERLCRVAVTPRWAQGGFAEESAAVEQPHGGLAEGAVEFVDLERAL